MSDGFPSALWTLDSELSLIHISTFSHIHRNDGLVIHKEIKGDPVADVDGNGMQILQWPLELMQSQGGVEGIDLEQFECLFVL